MPSVGSREGLRKGGLKNPDNAQISLGMCLVQPQGVPGDAIAAFREAAKTAEVPVASSNQWIRVIEADVERNQGQIQLMHVSCGSQEAPGSRRTSQAKRMERQQRI